MRLAQLSMLAVFALAAATAGANPPPCVEIPIPEYCAPCEGAINELTLVNASDRIDDVIIWQGDVVVFCDQVDPCETFGYFDGHWPGERGLALRIFVNDQPHALIPMDCSADVRPGMMFGDYMVVSGSSDAGPLCPLPMDCPPPDGPCGECEGKVTELTLRYTGPAATIRVDQKKDGTVFEDFVDSNGLFSFSGTDKNGTLGTEISLFVDGNLATEIHTSCSKPIGPGMVFGDFEVVAGASLKGGPLCPEDNPPGGGDDCDCDGKVTTLTLLYDGPPATVRVEQKDGEAIFDAPLDPGTSFTFEGVDKKGTMGTEITILVDGVPSVAIHTSCSKPIGPGLRVGDFEVLAGESRNGGTLCAVARDAQGDGQPKATKEKKKKSKKKSKKKK